MYMSGDLSCLMHCVSGLHLPAFIKAFGGVGASAFETKLCTDR